MSSFFVDWRVIDDAAIDFHPGVREERRRAVADDQTAVDAGLPQKSRDSYGTLQTANRLPVEAGRQGDRIANQFLGFRMECT